MPKGAGKPTKEPFERTTKGAENFPDSGGWWEYPHFGGPAIWHSASYSNPGRGPNMETFNLKNGNSPPRG